MAPALIGSFIAALLIAPLLTVAVVRLPRERRLAGWPACTRCGRPLSVWQLLPVVGWAAQGGRGRCCGRPLSWVYPLLELIFVGSVVWVFYRGGLSATSLYFTFVIAILVVTGAIDWLHRWIYTFVILGGTLVAVAGAAILPTHNLINALLGTLAAGFLFAIFFVLARALFPAHGAPFGLGDVYLAMFIGAAFGLTRLPQVLFLGMLLAGIFSIAIIVLRALGRPSPTYISYGTFLCLGALAFLVGRGY